jgi:hypothetical protein
MKFVALKVAGVSLFLLTGIVSGPPSGWLDGFAYFWRVTGASRQLQARKKAALRFHYRISV